MRAVLVLFCVDVRWGWLPDVCGWMEGLGGVGGGT